MLKKLWVLRKYIVAQGLLLVFAFSFVNYYTSVEYWSAPLSNIVTINGIFCAVCFVGIYICVSSALELELDGKQITFLKDMVWVWSLTLVLVLFVVSKYSSIIFGKHIYFMQLYMYAAFIVAPVFWIKLAIKLNLWLWGRVLALFINVQTIEKMIEKDRRGELGVGEALLRLWVLDEINASLKTELNLDVEEPNTEGISALGRRESTKSKTINEINENWSMYSFLSIGIVVVIIAGANIFNTLGWGYSKYTAKEQVPFFAVEDVMATDYDWVLVCKAYNDTASYYYDASSVAIDEDRNVVSLLTKYEKDGNIYIGASTIKIGEKKILNTDYMKNGRNTSDGINLVTITSNTIGDALYQKIIYDYRLENQVKYKGTLREYFESIGDRGYLNSRMPDGSISSINENYKMTFNNDYIPLLSEKFDVVRKIHIRNEELQDRVLRIVDRKYLPVGNHAKLLVDTNIITGEFTIRNQKNTTGINAGTEVRIVDKSEKARYFCEVDLGDRKVVAPIHISKLDVINKGYVLKVCYKDKNGIEQTAWVHSRFLDFVKYR